MDLDPNSPAAMAGLAEAIARKGTAVLEYLLALQRKLKRFYWRVPMSLNRGVISVELHANGVGLFATLTQVLYLLVYCDRNDYTPRIQLTGMNYVNPELGPNWFDYFFQYQPAYSDAEKSSPLYTLFVNNLDELGIGSFLLPTFTQLGTTLEEAHRVFFKYLRIKSDLEQAVESFRARHFAGRKILGVHYRGTDKGSEAPRVSWESCLDAVLKHLAENREFDAVFLATDEQEFVEYLRRGMRRVGIVVHDDAYRSSNGEAIHSHLFQGDNYQKGRDAMMNALLLSRCSALLRTTSALSGWASVFNPRLPVTLLNQPYPQTSWFPETEILKKAQTYSPMPRH